MKVVFRSHSAAGVFGSMAFGLSQTIEDDGGDCALVLRLDRLTDLVDDLVLQAREAGADSLQVHVPDDLRDEFDRVLENCLDNSSGRSAEDDDAGEFLFAGDVQLLGNDGQPLPPAPKVSP